MHCGSVMKHPIHSEGDAGASHLTAEQLLELVARGRRCPYYRQWLDHIALCTTCRTTYKYLLRAEMARRAASRRFVPLQRLVPAVAIGVLAVVGLVLWLRWDWLAAPVKNAREGIIERRGGVLYEGRTRLPDWAADAVALLSTPPPVVRSSGAAASAIRLLEPDPANEPIETLEPSFRWQPVSGATGYFATLTPVPDGEAILLRVEGTRAALPAGMRLAAGSRYRLRIEARLPKGLPGSNPAAQYEFRTLTPQEQTQLRWARQHRHDAPLTSAMVFYRLGFYRDALATLPDKPALKAWREAIAHQIAQRVPKVD
jgi:hypothetical protein